MSQWTEGDVDRLIINPLYAITVAPILAVEHEPLVSRDQWVGANLKAVEELGTEAWLHLLLDVLERGS